MPISFNINNTVNTVNRVNALIAALRNAATIIESISLLNEIDVLIDNLPHSERAVLSDAQTQAWFQTHQRLLEAPRQSRATMGASNRANALIHGRR
jgi:hypothetical protein